MLIGHWHMENVAMARCDAVNNQYKKNASVERKVNDYLYGFVNDF